MGPNWKKGFIFKFTLDVHKTHLIIKLMLDLTDEDLRQQQLRRNRLHIWMHTVREILSHKIKKKQQIKEYIYYMALYIKIKS